jgi:hypothetical protein
MLYEMLLSESQEENSVISRSDPNKGTQGKYSFIESCS